MYKVINGIATKLTTKPNFLLMVDVDDPQTAEEVTLRVSSSFIAHAGEYQISINIEYTGYEQSCMTLLNIIEQEPFVFDPVVEVEINDPEEAPKYDLSKE